MPQIRILPIGRVGGLPTVRLGINGMFATFAVDSPIMVNAEQLAAIEEAGLSYVTGGDLLAEYPPYSAVDAALADLAAKLAVGFFNGRSAAQVLADAGLIPQASAAAMAAFLKGAPGQTPAFTGGAVTMLPAGSAPTFQLTGTAPNYGLAFGIPAPANGVSPVFNSAVAVTQLAAGSPPTASIGGTPANPQLALGIPAPQDGASANIASVSVAMLAPGSQPTSSVSGPFTNRAIAIGIPRAVDGAPANISSASILMLPAGAAPTIAVGGSSPNFTLAFGIPQSAPPTLTISGLSVSTTSPGSAASGQVTRNGNDYSFAFSLPAAAPGTPGAAATISGVTVNTTAAGNAASASVTPGAGNSYALSFTIPLAPDGKNATLSGVAVNMLPNGATPTGSVTPGANNSFAITIGIPSAKDGEKGADSTVPGPAGLLEAGLTITGDTTFYIPCRVAMTIDQGNAPLGTGSVAYAKSTGGAPGTFTNTTLPSTQEAGSWLRGVVTGVSGFLALDLYRTT